MSRITTTTTLRQSWLSKFVAVMSLIFVLSVEIVNAEHKVVTATGNLLGCEEIPKITIVRKHFAHGQKKLVSEGKLAGQSVVVSQPYTDGAFYKEFDSEHGGDVRPRFMHYFRWERKILEALDGQSVPRLYGFCETDFDHVTNVVEYLRGWLDVSRDSRVPFASRVKIAANSFDVLRQWENFPAVVLEDQSKARTQVLYGDFQAAQFALNADLGVKVVDVQSFVPFEGRYGGEVACTLHTDCYNFYRTRHHVFGRLHSKPPEFQCNMTSGLCVGLDCGTNLYALCDTLLKPLFGFKHPPNSSAVGDTPSMRAVEKLICGCTEFEVARRSSLQELQTGFRELMNSLLHQGFTTPPLDLFEHSLDEDEREYEFNCQTVRVRERMEANGVLAKGGDLQKPLMTPAQKFLALHHHG